MFIDDEAVDDARLNRFSEMRIDQAMGMAWEAELDMPIGLDEAGRWSGIEEDFVQPMTRVRIEVRLGDGEFEALIDGPVVGQRFALDNKPSQSKLILVIHDDSIVLNRNETVAVHEEMSASDIASQLFADHDLEAEVDSVSMPAGGLERVIVQRGTAMALLRELARRHGMWLYIRPGETPGRSVGMFVRPRLATDGLPEILIIGRDRNCSRFDVSFDALRPSSARVDSVDALSVSEQSVEVEIGEGAELGEQGSHRMVEAGRTLLARTRETEQDLEAAANAAVDQSAWAYTGHGEVRSSAYPAVLSPYRVVDVAGAGRYLGGSYLISRVTHVINNAGYRQRFALRRNARSEASAGGLSEGVF